MLARFPITRPQIETVVTRFYAKIRVHPVLGPVFLRHVGTSRDAWEAHEAKIAAFWANAILLEGGYSGNPMRAHLAAGDVKPDHFALWLALFDETLAETLPEDTANAFSALAHRIGRGLRMGVEDRDAPAGAVPRL
ncbi:Group 3 truncated hemoglobin ctb [Pseudoruegeria aquimaris]|uniref:Group 3 truncated hemoglobin ctb n=1 Tax=Pseudoruegeria aquimaris TaxID=393663 RepID=A0A1Y5RWZ2_9RHOB|nr:group III truncated hemoglobin [Pseudoruegeria aquimaris]SLN27135.1 Group 3 truncated hemoglobin ctb [Pseudoruegeria aquimaris]